MTIPIQGHPDWRDVTAQRGAPFVDTNFNIAANATQQFGFYSAIGYGSVILRISPSSTGGIVTIYASDTGAFLSGSIYKQYVLRVNTTLWVRLPFPRDWVEVDLTAGSAGAWTGQIHLMTADIYPGKEYFGADLGGIDAVNQALAPGIGAVLSPIALIPGPAMMWITNTGSPGAILHQIVTLDPQGSVDIVLSQWSNLAAFGITQNIILPETQWQYRVTNNTAGAINWWASIMPQGSTL